jgi:hypothetical protein
MFKHKINDDIWSKFPSSKNYVSCINYRFDRTTKTKINLITLLLKSEDSSVQDHVTLEINKSYLLGNKLKDKTLIEKALYYGGGGCSNYNNCICKDFVNTHTLQPFIDVYSKLPKGGVFLDTNSLKPYQIIRKKNFSDTFNFKCNNCTHIFEKQGSRISNNKPQVCSYCTTSPKIALCPYDPKNKDTNCDICIKNSLGAKNKLYLEFWDYQNNKEHPYQVREYSNNKYQLICQEPNCNNPKIIIPHGTNTNNKNILCEKCFTWEKVSNPYTKPKPNKSLGDFIDREGIVIDPLDQNKNKLTFYDITRSTKKHYFFICQDCTQSYKHPISKSLANIFHKNCEYNKNMPSDQKQLFKFLNKTFPGFNWIPEKKFKWATNGNGNSLRYDVVSVKHKIILEYDGEQHFYKIYQEPYVTQLNDILKMKLAFENDYKIIRLSYKYKKNNDWKHYIQESINQLSCDGSSIIKLCSPELYFEHTKDEFINLLLDFTHKDDTLYNYIPLPPIPL